MKLLLIASLLLISFPQKSIPEVRSFLKEHFPMKDLVAGTIAAGGIQLYGQLLIQTLHKVDDLFEDAREKQVNATSQSKLKSILKYIAQSGAIIAVGGALSAVKVDRPVIKSILMPLIVHYEQETYNLNAAPLLLLMWYNAGLVGAKFAQETQK